MSIVAWVRGQALALFFVLTGLVAVVLAARIPETGFQSEFDPGSRLLPTLMGVALMVGGVVEAVRARKKAAEVNHMDSDLGKFSLVLVLLALYVAMLPYLGFSIATVAVTTVVARVMGSPWWVALVLAVGLVVGVHLLFVYLFRVPLPSSAWGLPA